jgi:hypothetical protein
VEARNSAESGEHAEPVNPPGNERVQAGATYRDVAPRAVVVDLTHHMHPGQQASMEATATGYETAPQSDHQPSPMLDELSQLHLQEARNSALTAAVRRAKTILNQNGPHVSNVRRKLCGPAPSLRAIDERSVLSTSCIHQKDSLDRYQLIEPRKS